MLITLIGLLLVAGPPTSPNPFLGTWDVTWVGIETGATLRFTIHGEVWDMVPPMSELGPYTYTSDTLHFAGETWVYFISTPNRLSLIGWHETEEGKHIPVIMILDRVDPTRDPA